MKYIQDFLKERRIFLKKEKVYRFLMDYEENLNFCLEFPKALIVTTTSIVLIILFLTGRSKLFFVAAVLSLLIIVMPILIFFLKAQMAKNILKNIFQKILQILPGYTLNIIIRRSIFLQKKSEEIWKIS